jgi:hypothetical protein
MESHKEILSADISIKTNAELMVNVAAIGYLRGHVLDTTYGKGNFWKKFKPERLTKVDLKPVGDVVSDFRTLPFPDNTFDTVVLDGPYKLNGTPSLEDFDERYGIDIPTHWKERNALIKQGILECMRVTRDYLLVKCQDQVCSGHVRWQTAEFTDHAEWYGNARLVDRFDLVGSRRPQPANRSQVHARRNYSTLLVLEKK